MKIRTSRGTICVCDKCGCQGYARDPNKDEEHIKDCSFWRCPNCGYEFIEYNSYHDDV